MGQAEVQRRRRRPRLGNACSRACRSANCPPHTQRAHVENIARFARHFGRSPADLGPEEIRTYQVYLIRERHLAPSSLEIAVCALRFLYKVTLKQPWSFDDLIPAPKKPRRLPIVLSPGEVVRALECVSGLGRCCV